MCPFSSVSFFSKRIFFIIINRDSLGKTRQNKRAQTSECYRHAGERAFRALAQLRKYDEEIMKSRAINNASATAGGI